MTTPSTTSSRTTRQKDLTADDLAGIAGDFRGHDTIDPTPWEFVASEYPTRLLAGTRHATISPLVPHYTPPRWRPRDRGLSEVQKDALWWAGQSGVIVTIDRHRSGWAVAGQMPNGDPIAVFNVETVRSLANRGLIEHTERPSTIAHNLHADAYRLTLRKELAR